MGTSRFINKVSMITAASALAFVSIIGFAAPAMADSYPTVETPCTSAGSLTWTRNADLSVMTVTLKAGTSITSCDVSLTSYETQGASWDTSGVQRFVDFTTAHLSTNYPTATLKLNGEGCFRQNDASIGKQRFDGVGGPLPLFPRSAFPSGVLFDHWNGAVPCTTTTILATPPAPVVTGPTCDVAGALPALTGGEHYTAVYDRAYAGPGVYTAIFTAQNNGNAHYTFGGGKTSVSYALTVQDKSTENCIKTTTLVTPLAPVVTGPTCIATGALPSLTGGEHYTAAYDRAFAGPGVYTAIFTVKNDAYSNYTFADNKTSVSFPLTVEDKKACADTTVTTTTTPAKTLAYTGSDNTGAVLIGGLFVLAGLMLFGPSRRGIFGFMRRIVRQLGVK